AESKTVLVKSGKPTVVEVLNTPESGLRLRKIESITKQPIYNTEFMLFDKSNKVVGVYYTDNRGIIDFVGDLPAGRYTLRETRPAPGYFGDDVPRTVEITAGEVTEIVWENEPCRGQIVITKRSMRFNAVTNLPAGSPLAGAVFEVFSVSGNLVDRMVSDAKGVAASKPLPLGVYVVKEVTPPKYYTLNPREFLADLRHNGDIVRFEVLDDNVNLGVTIRKKGPNAVTPGQVFLYDLYDIANTSNVPLQNFYVHDRLPTDAVRGAKLFTGTWSARLTYRVTYKTNYTSNYKVLASGLSTQNQYELSLHPNVLGLMWGEYVTDIRFEFGTVPAGFRSVANPKIQVQVLSGLAKDYKIVNRADAGGLYIDTWETSMTNWLSVLAVGPSTGPILPKTGF
ncbi:MAG: SpaA isopeptide-forming pilin-related protein, partial [Oscillospiraceae bacterium]|nr:SpaA isopeptide-forming pilin-related protein [Oscillospiraceae bacterium]